MDKDILYYDGDCPLCRAEINKLRYFTRDRLILMNIHRLGPDEAAPDKAVLLARLHLKTADGEWLTGIDANIRAWRHTPLRYLWEILGWPFIRPLSERAYEFWLRRRAARQTCDVSR